MGYSIQRNGFTTVKAMMPRLIADLKAAGFTQLYPADDAEGRDVLLKASATVDPLADTQPWCIRFMWDRDPTTAGAGGGTPPEDLEKTVGARLDILVAPPEQFPGNKCVPYKVKSTTGADTNTIEYLGLIGTMAGRTTTGSTPQPIRSFIDRTGIEAASFSVYPLCYRLSVSDRGFALAVWEQSTESTANRFSWLVVQRPVDNKTGAKIVSGKAPVHCAYGLMGTTSNNPNVDGAGQYNIRRFVVREEDVVSPYPRQTAVPTPIPSTGTPMMGADATRNTIGYSAVLNPTQQVSITENNKYQVTFPTGFNTSRHTYTHDMDMVAYLSADVVAQGTEVPLRVYDESEDRSYIALGANGPNNSGMRLLMLVNGGGVEPAPVEP